MDEMYGIRTTGDDADYYSDKALLMISPDDQNMNGHLLQADYSNYNLHQYHYNPPPSSDHHHHRRIDPPAFDPQSEGSGLTNADRLQPSNDYDVIKARIASHPSYPKLLNAYIDCQKVGAPPEIAFMLEEISREKDAVCKHDIVLGLDPELDNFMESYYDVLVKYKTDLSRPIDEATSFISSIETQLANLCSSKAADDDTLSSEEEFSGVQDPANRTEDRELKDQLMRRYGNHINSLKVEFSKKKKKGKLPKEARQTLLEWWSVHYKWPYPTEVDKISLAETTGLDQKQINNWFINQRKRHWKPSENMHLAMMDHSQSGHFFLED